MKRLYKTVVANLPKALDDKVTDLLNSKEFIWELHGIPYRVGEKFCQAVVCREYNKNIPSPKDW